MSKRIFTPEQIRELLSNANVSRCSERSVTYSKAFKVKAVSQYAAGSTSREIFEAAGFELKMIGRDMPKDTLKRWNKIHKTKGVVGLATETRGRGGGRPKINDVTDADKIKRLEAQVAYLKAENDFLAKLRAKRRE